MAISVDFFFPLRTFVTMVPVRDLPECTLKCVIICN